MSSAQIAANPVDLEHTPSSIDEQSLCAASEIAAQKKRNTRKLVTTHKKWMSFVGVLVCLMHRFGIPKKDSGQGAASPSPCWSYSLSPISWARSASVCWGALMLEDGGLWRYRRLSVFHESKRNQTHHLLLLTKREGWFVVRDHQCTVSRFGGLVLVSCGLGTRCDNFFVEINMADDGFEDLEPSMQNLVDQDSLKWIFVGGKGGFSTVACKTTS